MGVGAYSRLGANLRLGAYSNKYGIDFAHFGQELGIVFEGTTFQFKMINKNQKYANLSNNGSLYTRAF